VLAEIVLAELVGRFARMRGELADGPDVGLLGSRREPAELHVLEHALAEWRHGVPFRAVGSTAPARMRRDVTHGM
jgi:hypothetical protein